MNNLTLIANMLIIQNQNQLALAAAVEELSNWIEQRGSVEVADNVRSTLVMLDKNLASFSMGITKLIADGALEDGAANDDLS